MGVRVVAMATKFGPKIALISSLRGIGKFIACAVGISGLVNFNTLSEFLREPRKSQDIGLANSNMLSQFSGEPRELPWQPNLNKSKPKLHWFQSCARNRGIFRMKSQDFGSATSNMLSQFLREPPNRYTFVASTLNIGRNLTLRFSWNYIDYANWGNVEGTSLYQRRNPTSNFVCIYIDFANWGNVEITSLYRRLASASYMRYLYVATALIECLQ